MPRFYLKPLIWNTKAYERPAGVTALGYPTKKGFGHEEWNNSPRLSHNGTRYFYTNYLKNFPGDIDMPFAEFMIASHDGIQQLVGVAGKTSVIPPQKRRATGSKFADEAWITDSVKAAFLANEGQFRHEWQTEIALTPNCTCPDDHYLWLTTPVTLNPQEITGKSRLITMFSRAQTITHDQAQLIMQAIPEGMRDEKWRNIVASIDLFESTEATGWFASFPTGEDYREDQLGADLEILARRGDLHETTRARLINARLGQGNFRKEVMKLWNNTCAITGCTVPDVLQACHIKPWRECSDQERLDPMNGVVLTANLHALFDAGLIEISTDGVHLAVSQDKANFTGLWKNNGKRIHFQSEQLSYLHYRKSANEF